MKNIKYIMMAAVCTLFASCMGDRYAETDEAMPAPYGNNELTETNVISIADLKTKFAKPINTDYREGISYEQVTENLQAPISPATSITNLQSKIKQEPSSFLLGKADSMVSFLSARKYLLT